MIGFSLYLQNPFSKKFKSIFFKVGTLSKHKYWDFEINQTNVLLGMEFSWTAMTDHAGVKISLALLTYELSFQIYDHRHWNSMLNTWDRK